MADIVGMLKQRQGDDQNDVYARKIGVSPSGLYHYYNGTRDIGLSAARKMAEYFRSAGDQEMVNALGLYLLEPEECEAA